MSYILRRTTFALILIFVAVTMNFILFRALPGDAVSNMARVPGATVETQERLKQEFGLDGSLLTQYFQYVRQLVKGNLGVSFVDRQPVSERLSELLRNTVPMVLTGTVLAIVIGVVSGVIAAVRANSKTDHAVITTSLVFYSLPSQWLGLMLIVLFAGLLPSGGRVDPFALDQSGAAHFFDVAKHMVLPSLTLALVLSGQYALVVRSSMMDALAADYVMTARAKGLAPRKIAITHGLRNALLPIATLVALSLGYVVAGAILIETVFSWPGIGRAVYQAVLQRDFPMLQGAFLVLTVSVVFFNYLADLLYLKLDPRIAR